MIKPLTNQETEEIDLREKVIYSVLQCLDTCRYSVIQDAAGTEESSLD